MNKWFLSIMSLFGGCLCSCGQQNFKNVNADEFQSIISSGSIQVLDVRHSDEFTEGHIAVDNVINIDVQQSDFLDKATKALDKTRPVAVYCRSGHRSANAASILAKAGFTVTNLNGGILAWQAAGKPIQKSADVFTTASGKKISIEFYYHASLCINYNGYKIQVDPVGKKGVIDYKGLKADAILITHEHYDHYSKPDVDALRKQSTVLIMNKRVGDMYGEGIVMKIGDERELCSGIGIKAVPAYNTTPGHTQYHPQGRDNGYVLTIENMRIYIAADTEPIPDMKTLGAIDIAFMPCNQPFTMTPEQLIVAAKMVKPKVLYPYHYSETDLSAVPEALKGSGIDVRIRNMQ
jgi:L-ascorbate metabolism protein UlaG (beta-lactamase superfamily)/rhodanese-related sulfurtransferase